MNPLPELPRNVPVAIVVAVVAFLVGPASASAFDPALEAQNFAKTSEREQYVTATPEFQKKLNEESRRNLVDAAEIKASDPERVFSGNVCANGGNECAGDVRFYDWKDEGFGLVKSVLFTARNGSTISGRLWATRNGPAQRPLIVFTNGSVQAPERLYWGQAATLASHGYVVLTYDPQGQGRSDTFGEGVDRNDGVPSQTGRPFFDGTEDALDFALSTPSKPYDPRPSCTSGTDHSPKQDRRVAEGFNADFNPLWDLVDPERVGIAGHSLGAAAVSYIGQLDPRVDAIAAYDNLQAAGHTPSEVGGSEVAGIIEPPECESGSSKRPDKIALSKPGLGITNDYGIAPTPFTADPDPQEGNNAFLAYKDAGTDSMEVQIRGGTHEESAFIPGVTIPLLGLASLRGTDIVAWYSTAWFDKYVKCAGNANCKRDADERILTDRWRDDLRSGQVDSRGDSNVFSFYKRSRYALKTTKGELVSCDDMRAGCGSMTPDSLPAGYDFVSDAYSPDEELTGGRGGGGSCALPQLGTDSRDDAESLPPSDSGDAIRGRSGDDDLDGAGGDDCLYGGGGNDRLDGGAGDDKLKGGAGSDSARGGRGADHLNGGAGRDTLRGGSGSDKLVGRAGFDTIKAGPGKDLIRVKGGSRDIVNCGPGKDRVIADPRDRISPNCEVVLGI